MFFYKRLHGEQTIMPNDFPWLKHSYHQTTIQLLEAGNAWAIRDHYYCWVINHGLTWDMGRFVNIQKTNGPVM